MGFSDTYKKTKDITDISHIVFLFRISDLSIKKQRSSSPLPIFP